jgi:hypothetical protein
MGWFINCGGEPKGPLSERQIVAMLRAGARLDAVAREVDTHWHEPAEYPPFAKALAWAEDPTHASERAPRRARMTALMAVGGVVLLSTFAVLRASQAWESRAPIAESGAKVVALSDTAAPSNARRAADLTALAANEAPAEATSPGTRDACNVEELWFRGRDLTPAQRRTNVVQNLEKWTPDCRRRALEGLCRMGCEGILSEALLAAAPKEERASLAKLRAEHNRDAAQRARAIYGEIVELGHYAAAVTSNGAVNKDVPSAQPPTAADDAAWCEARAPNDAERTAAIGRELETDGALPPGGYWMKEALRVLQNCLRCGENRWSCDDVPRLLKSADDEIRAYDHRAEAEKRVAAARFR